MSEEQDAGEGLTNTPAVKLNPREWETVAQKLDWMIETLEHLATTWTGRQEGRPLDFGHGEISLEEALEQITQVAGGLERTFTSERTRDHVLKRAHENGEDTAAVGLRFERLSRVFGRLSGLTLEHSPIPHTHPKKNPGRRLNLKPPTRPLAFPNEPGYRGLLYAITQEKSAWEVTADGLTIRTTVDGPDKRPLSIVMQHFDQQHSNALGTALELLPPSEDGTALKILIALPALFFDHNPDAAYNAVYETTIPDLMRYMGFKAKNGAFERDDQHRVWRAICLLNQVWVPGVTWRSKKGREKEVTGQGVWFSPVIVLQGIQQGEHGITLPHAVRYSLGKDFHAYYNGDAGTRTRMLTISPKIMELHGRRDINLLRLAVYYASQLRINQQGFRHGAQQMDFAYSTLLTKAGIPIDKVNPKRQFGRVVAWHDELVAKGLIGDYVTPSAPVTGSPYKDYASLIFWVSPAPSTPARGA